MTETSTEQPVLDSEPVETPNHETFNIIDALQGITFPSDEVTVFLDANIMYLRDKAEKQLRLEQLRPDNEDRVKELEEQLQNLLEQAQSVKFTFHVRAIPRDTHKAILATLEKEHPVQKDVFQRDVPDPIRDEAYMSKLWAAHITKIESPSGSVQVGISEADAATLRGQLPDVVVAEVQSKMDDLYEGSKRGYESAIQETNFLSGASQEA